MPEPQRLKQTLGRLWMFLFVLCLPLMLPFTTYAAPGDNLDVYFMDVGQGDGALLESDGKYMLIDCGPEAASDDVMDFLREQGVTELEYIIASHGHHDHCGGFLSVLEEIPVKQLYFPSQTPVKNSEQNFYSRFQTLLQEKNIQPIRPIPGESITFGSTTITFYAPKGDSYNIFNNTSIVAKVVNGDNSFLFTGDAELESEDEMVASFGDELKADVLKVGHHSAWTSTNPNFLEKVDPSFSVISCGYQDASGFPRAKTLNRLRYTNVYRTDIQSTIHFSSDGTTIFVDKDAGQKAVASAKTGEMKNIYNTQVVSNLEGIHLMKKGDKSEESILTEQPVTIDFSAEFGVTEQESIKYMLVPQGGSYMGGRWQKGNSVTISDEFNGAVFVRYENSVGDVLIRKTNDILFDRQAINSVTVESTPKVELYPVDSVIPDNTVTALKQLDIFFYADFGPAGMRSIEYMLVEDNEQFQPNGHWEYSNNCIINGPFSGYVYVKFTDGVNHSVIYRSDHIVVEGESVPLAGE